MQVAVTIYRDDGSPFAFARILSRLTEVGTGVLSDEHSQSSYGQAILVLPSGDIMSSREAREVGYQLAAIGVNGNADTDEHDPRHQFVRDFERLANS